MSKTNKSKSGSRSSRSRSASRSRSRSFSKSRSRSRSVSRSRKRRLSSRSRSRSYSPAHNRERNHPRVYQNRDFRGHNRGYRRPYYFRGRNRGFYPWGQYNRGGYGNYRSNWQNYRQAYSPRRGRSRSRSPKRRSPSPRSRSHSRNSDKSSSDRSRRSSSSRSSSNHSRVESSKRKSAKEKKSSSKDSRPSQSAGDNQGEEAKEQTFSGGTSQDTKASESSKPWADGSTYSAGSASRAVSDMSPRERSPALKSPLQSVVVRRRSPRPSPVPKPSPPLSSSSQMGSGLQSGSGYQAGTHQGQFDHGSGSLSPSKKSPVGKSPPATGSTYGSSQKEEAASGGAAYTKRPSGLLAQERKLSRDLVHSNKKEQEFRSIFQHIQSAQSQRSPSELFAQHIVTIVHHVKEHHFGSSGMTLHERFTKYLKRGTEQEAAKNKKSPEIHRRIDISPSTFRKHGLAHDEMKSPREPGYKAEGKYKDDPVDLRLDIERRKKHKERDLKRGKSRESVDSRDSSHSRERSAEKTEKTHKGSKKQKKHRRTRDRSRSSSSSSQSSHSYKAEEYTEETEEREESTTGFDKSRLGTKDFVGPNERGGRARGTFQFRARGRGWGRGSYSGNNNNSSNNDFQKRSREEEWDPEYTPKSKKYYLHDDREGEGSEKWGGRGRGRGAFPRGRGRFMFRKSSTSPKWAHDKFSGEEGEIEDDESGTENREEKDNSQPTTE